MNRYRNLRTRLNRYAARPSATQPLRITRLERDPRTGEFTTTERYLLPNRKATR